MAAPIGRITRMRDCAGIGCPMQFATPHGGDWPAKFCSPECHRDTKRAEAPTPRRTQGLVTRAPAKPKSHGLATVSVEQREAMALRACIVCREQPVDPAHLIPAGVCPDGDGDPRAVIPLCRRHHDEYDREKVLDLLPYLEPHFRTELAFAVERFGLVSTLRRVTNERQ